MNKKNKSFQHAKELVTNDRKLRFESNYITDTVTVTDITDTDEKTRKKNGVLPKGSLDKNST